MRLFHLPGTPPYVTLALSYKGNMTKYPMRELWAGTPEPRTYGQAEVKGTDAVTSQRYLALAEILSPHDLFQLWRTLRARQAEGLGLTRAEQPLPTPLALLAEDGFSAGTAPAAGAGLLVRAVETDPERLALVLAGEDEVRPDVQDAVAPATAGWGLGRNSPSRGSARWRRRGRRGRSGNAGGG